MFGHTLFTLVMLQNLMIFFPLVTSEVHDSSWRSSQVIVNRDHGLSSVKNPINNSICLSINQAKLLSHQKTCTTFMFIFIIYEA